jgi:hypothetical protein
MIDVSVARVDFVAYTIKRKRKILFASGWAYSSLIAVAAEFSTRAKMGRCITVLEFVPTGADWADALLCWELCRQVLTGQMHYCAGVRADRC